MENREIINKYYCNRCNNEVSESTLKDYEYQCLECDEDLYSFEVYKKEKHLLNWKKVAIYNFKEWYKDADNKFELDVFSQSFIKESDIKEYISCYEYEDILETTEYFELEELEEFLKDVFIDKEDV